MNFLENDIVRLRAVEPDDALKMWECDTDSSQWLHCGMMAPVSKENLAQYAVTYNPDPWEERQLRLVIEQTENGKMSGLVDLYQMHPAHHAAFVGIYVSPEFRRRGIATSSLHLLESYASRLLNVAVLAAKIADGNEASIRLFAKCGYSHCGTLHQWIQSGAKRMNMMLFEKKLF